VRSEFNTSLSADVKDTLLTRKRQLTADSDSNSLLGVSLLVCNKAKYYLPSSLFSSDNQNNHTETHGSDTHFTYTINHMVVNLFSS
jgi:hypothetical protein